MGSCQIKGRPPMLNKPCSAGATTIARKRQSSTTCSVWTSHRAAQSRVPAPGPGPRGAPASHIYPATSRRQLRFVASDCIPQTRGTGVPLDLWFCWWWQVMGSNHRRPSRRFYSNHPAAGENSRYLARCSRKTGQVGRSAAPQPRTTVASRTYQLRLVGSVRR
jgi:hypothetical protein